MSTRILLLSACLFLAAIGLLLSFVPDHLMERHGWPADRALSVLLQCTGGLCLGLAMLDWMAKGQLLGGIYGRPIVSGNLLAFVVAALALLKPLVRGELPATAWCIAGPCIVFAVFFGKLLFTSPKPAGVA